MPKKRSHGDGGLYYLKSKKLWRGTIELGPDPVTGERRTKTVHSKSQKACREKKERIEGEIRQHGAPIDNTATVATWAPLWLETHKKPHVDPHTFTAYASLVNRWIVPTIGTKRIAALKPSDITAIHVRARDAGKTTTATRAHRVVSMMLDDARKEGLCARNVAADVKPPRAAPKKRDSIPLPMASDMLARSAGHDLASMWWFKMLGGARQGEILGATLDSLDLDNRIYRVNWSLEEVPKEHGCKRDSAGLWSCGKKQGAACSDWRWRIPDNFEMVHLSGRWCLTRPKSLTGRTIPLFPQLADMIEDYLERHEDTLNPHGLIWRQGDGSPYLPKPDAQAFRELLLAAGVITKAQAAPGKSPVDGHWARHTTVTLLASLGVDAQIIGEIVGHSSEEVTRIYRHLHAEEKAAAMAKLGGLMTPKAIDS